MYADLGTLATALHVKIDDLLTGSPHRAAWWPQVGLKPQINDAELASSRADPDLVTSHAGQTLIADKNYYGSDFEADPTGGPDRCQTSAAAPGPQGRTRTRRPTVLQTSPPTIESIIDAGKGQLDLERHGAHTPAGVLIRILQRLLALTAAIWHNDKLGLPTKRSLLAYDH